MPFVLLLVGLLCLVGGALALAQGIAQPGLRFLDAVSSTIAVVGGFILIGMGSIAARLQRIADAIEAQAVRDALSPAMEPHLPSVAPPAALGAAAVAAALGEPAPQEPASSELPPKPAPQPTIAMAPNLGPSLSPSGPPAGELRLPEPAATASEPEWPRIDASDRMTAPDSGSAWPQPQHAEPSVPGSPSPSASPASGPSPPPPAGAVPPPPDVAPSRAGTASEPPAPSGPPAPPPVASSVHAPVQGPPAPVAADDEEEPAAEELPRVLKSGIIEGMAYTLYSDGSVDAELKGGTRHFASIAEWRTHLREGV